jgi:hypothetical protein
MFWENRCFYINSISPLSHRDTKKIDKHSRNFNPIRFASSYRIPYVCDTISSGGAMKRFRTFIAITPLIVSSLFAQLAPRIELTTSFPLNVSQTGSREYFMTTKYSATVALNLHEYVDLISTATYAQQKPLEIQRFAHFAGASSASSSIFVPFTVEPYYAEYGMYSGIRLMTRQNNVQAFVRGQFGVVGTKYGTIEQVRYKSPESLPGSEYSYREVEGSVVKFQYAIMYGVGLIFHPISHVSLSVDLHAVDRWTNQPLDVYRSVGIQFEF